MHYSREDCVKSSANNITTIKCLLLYNGVSYVKPRLNTYADASSGPMSNLRSSVFTYIHTLCIRTVKAPSRVCICAGSTAPSLFDNLISTNIKCAGTLMSCSVVVDSLLIVTPIVGFFNCSLFCCALLCVHSSFAIISMGKRGLVAMLCLSSWCSVIVVWPFLTMPWNCLQFVIVVFPDHTHFLFLTYWHSLRHD